jgi:DNA-binding MarR family transcriptional regulator
MVKLNQKIDNVNNFFYDKKEIPFIKIPTEILNNKKFFNLSPRAFLLYAHLRNYSSGNYNYCYPSTNTLTQKMGVSRQTISSLIKELEEFQLIRVERNKGFVNRYYFILDNKNLELVKNNYSKNKSNSKSNKDLNLFTPTCTDNLGGGVNHSLHDLKDPRVTLSNNSTKAIIEPETKKNKNVVIDNIDNNINNPVDTINIKQIKQTIDKHKELLSQLPPQNIKPLVSADYKRQLEKQYSFELVNLVLAYTVWTLSQAKSKIYNICGFIISILKNPVRVDFSQYFNHLEYEIIKEKAKQKRLEAEKRHLEQEKLIEKRREDY